MSDLIYARPSDNVAALVTPTPFTGTTINALYPLTRLIDRDPATAAKSSSTGDFRIVWDFGAAQRVDAVWVPMYNAPAGNIPRFEGHASSSWAGPTISVARTVPAYSGGLPRGLFFDITEDPDYTDIGLRFWSLIVPNPSQVTAIGEVFISSRKRTAINFEHGLRRPRQRLTTSHPRADGGVFVYDRGVTLLTLSGRLLVETTPTLFDDMLLLEEDCRGPLLPFPIVTDGHLADPEGHLVRWASAFEASVAGPGEDYVNVTWQMVPRGRAL